MGFIPRRRIKENLREVEVFYEDTNNEIFKVQDIPDTFVQGRSAFKIFGSRVLQPNIPLKIEIVDKSGSPVWVQPVKYGQVLSPQLPFRYISVEVYPPPYNVAGEAELIILGQLNPNNPFTRALVDNGTESGEIPLRFQNAYNVRFRKTINIDTEKVINEQPILFYKKPKITATELVKPQRKLDAPDNRFISGSQIYGIVNADVAGTSYPSSSEVNTQEEVFDTSQTPSADLAVQSRHWPFKTGIQEKNPFLEKFGLKEERR